MDLQGVHQEQARHQTNVVCWLAVRVALTLAVMAVCPCGSYPHGPPEEACRDMRPKHGSGPMTSTSPYELDIEGEATTYSPNVDIRVRIVGTTFVGFMLQVRRAEGSRWAPVGRFEAPPTYAKHLNCDHKFDTVTHANNGPKWNMEFTWRPPDQNRGPIQFVATMVFRWDTFWMNVTSDILWPRGYPEPVVTSPPTEAPTSATISTTTTTTTSATAATTTTHPGGDPRATTASTTTYRVSMTTRPTSRGGRDDKSTTSRPIIIDEDQFPLISSAPGHLSFRDATVFLGSLVISCSIAWLCRLAAGPQRTS